jgi:propanol-preferring alcohol dehydrogenase
MNADEELARPEIDASTVGVSDPAAANFLVRVGAAGIGESGVRILNPKEAMVPLPLTLGREAAGFVARFGAGVKGPQGAQTVLVAGIWGCATCVACLSGRDSTCEYWARHTPAMLDGEVPFSDAGIWGMTSTSARRRALVGDRDRVKAVPRTDAGIAPCRAINLALPHLRAAATVAVIAVGGVGPVVVQVLRTSTAYRILALDSDAARLSTLKGRGTDDGLVSQLIPAMEQTPCGLSVRSRLDVAGMLANAIVARYDALVAAGLGTGSFLIVGDAPSPVAARARNERDL